MLRTLSQLSQVVSRANMCDFHLDYSKPLWEQGTGTGNIVCAGSNMLSALKQSLNTIAASHCIQLALSRENLGTKKGTQLYQRRRIPGTVLNPSSSIPISSIMGTTPGPTCDDGQRLPSYFLPLHTSR